MKEHRIHIIYITVILFIISAFGAFWYENREIELNYYVEQNLITNDSFAMEVEMYHPTGNNVRYCFENKMFKTCFKKHQ